MDVQWRDVAAIFTDIAGFTSLDETAAPDVLGTLLNEYVGGMTDVVFSHEGDGFGLPPRIAEPTDWQ
jgi:adenylate cyclase